MNVKLSQICFKENKKWKVTMLVKIYCQTNEKLLGKILWETLKIDKYRGGFVRGKKRFAKIGLKLV